MPWDNIHNWKHYPVSSTYANLYRFLATWIVVQSPYLASKGEGEYFINYSLTDNNTSTIGEATISKEMRMNTTKYTNIPEG